MRHRWLALTIVLAGCGGGAPAPAPKPGLLPISADELRRDLMVFANDSFQGRETGTPSANKAAQFLVQRLVALGVEPAGDSMYFQRVPLVKERFAPETRLTVSRGPTTIPLTLGTDVTPFISLGIGAPPTKRNVSGDIYFAGYGMTSNGRNDFDGIKEAGKVIVMLQAAPPSVTDSAERAKLDGQPELEARLLRALQMQPAAVILLMTGKTKEFYDQAAPELLRSVAAAPGDMSTMDSQRPLPMVILGLAKAGSPLLPDGWPRDDAPQALTGRKFTGRVEVRKESFTGYNVVGIVRGSDPRLNKTYVAYGAHYDHIGILPGASDSIANGADDDGSGSVTMLAIAKSLTTARPKRSSLFVWHIGEEKGLLGSNYFVDHPTVPIDSIVAQLNSDMIGRRGGANSTWDSKVSGASAVNRLYVVGPQAAPNDQSKTLGAILDTVNGRQMRPMQLDHEWDSPTHPERIYFRSDHYNYARKGIPIVFFTTGLHEDYHKVSDTPDKIDYEKMARIGSLLLELGTTLGNREGRPTTGPSGSRAPVPQTP
jgi:hypothetical protein